MNDIILNTHEINGRHTKPSLFNFSRPVSLQKVFSAAESMLQPTNALSAPPQRGAGDWHRASVEPLSAVLQ